MKINEYLCQRCKQRTITNEVKEGRKLICNKKIDGKICRGAIKLISTKGLDEPKNKVAPKSKKAD